MKAFWKNIIVTVLAFLIVFVLAMFAVNTSFLSPIAEVVKDFEMTDVYYQILQESDSWDESEEITIVDMSDLYSRRELAEALDGVMQQKPRVVGVDVVFEGLREDSVGDDMVRQVADTYRNIVWSFKLLEYRNDSIGYTDSVRSFFAFENEKVTEGFTNMPRNLYGGIKRNLSLGRPLMGVLKPSFLLKVTSIYEGRDMAPLEDRDLEINFTPTVFHVVSPDSIAEHADLIRDHLVLFGAMKDEYDMHYTPLGKIAGVELLAYGAQTLMQQNEKKTVTGWMLGVISFLMVLITQYWLSGYKAGVLRIKQHFLRFILSTSVVKSILLCFWMWLLMWVAFILFCWYDVAVNFGYAFSGMAFLVLAGTMYDEFKTYKTS